MELRAPGIETTTRQGWKKGEDRGGMKKILLSNYLTESANPRASPKDEKCLYSNYSTESANPKTSLKDEGC